MARFDPSYGWTQETYMLHHIYQSLVGEKVPYPWEERKSNLPEFEAVDVDEFIRWHDQTFKEVNTCQTL